TSERSSSFSARRWSTSRGSSPLRRSRLTCVPLVLFMVHPPLSSPGCFGPNNYSLHFAGARKKSGAEWVSAGRTAARRSSPALGDRRKEIANEDIDAAEEDECLIRTEVPGEEALIAEQRHNRGGEAEHLAHGNAAVAIEVGQQSADCRDARAEKGRPPVHVQ